MNIHEEYLSMLINIHIFPIYKDRPDLTFVALKPHISAIGLDQRVNVLWSNHSRGMSSSVTQYLHNTVILDPTVVHKYLLSLNLVLNTFEIHYLMFCFNMSDRLF